MNIFPESLGNPQSWVAIDPRQRYLLAKAALSAIEPIVTLSLGLAPEPLALPRRRTRPAVLARQIVLYLAMTEALVSATMLGRLYGRHRTSVAHAVRRIEERREVDPGLDRAMDLMARLIRSEIPRKLQALRHMATA